MQRSLIMLTVLAGLASAVAAQSPTRLLERGALSRAKGEQGSPLMVYEVADFQCPFCARFAREVFPRIDSAYVKTGKVQWFFVNLPLPNHANAWAAAEAALCAGAVGDRFWAVHDRLFLAQSEWAGVKDPAGIFMRYAREAGVAEEAFGECTARDQVAALIIQDVIYAARVGITGTPGFILNNDQRIVGFKSFDEWRELLDKALKAR